MEIRESWAVSRDRIERFFLEQPEVIAETEGFSFGDCLIRLTDLPPRRLGPVEMSYTLVEMTGGDRDTEEIYRRFFLRFISAGG